METAGDRDNSLMRAVTVPDGTAVERIERDEGGHLVLHLKDADAPINDVQLTRYFPWSMPETYIAIRDSDGGEVVMLRTLDELDPASRKIAEAELRDKVFNPKIHRVLDYKHEFGISSITAETDRGEVIFQFRGRRDVRQLSPTRALFRDVDGNTYELSDFSRLDPVSQRYLHRYF